MPDPIVVERAGNIATVRLNRPEKHNAIDKAMFDAFIDVGKTLAAERSLRAVVLTGNGANFCAGIDLSMFAMNKTNFEPKTLAARDDSLANYYQSAAYVWRELPVPVLAALRGAVFGGGLQISLGADLRFCHPEAQLSVMESKWGIIPDMGLTTTLPSLMPLDKALSLTWSGRIVSGSEACTLGLVTSVTEDPERDARRCAEEIAARSPDAIRAAKRLLQAAWAGRDAELLRLEAELQLKVLAAPNQAEAVQANLEKRQPEFSDAVV